MTDFQIAVQIVATSIMALTSFMMLVVSGFLAWNAIKMREINEFSNKISLWNHRYDVFREIVLWQERLIVFVKKIDNGIITTEDDSRFSELGVPRIESATRKGKVLFSEDKILQQYFTDWFVRMHPISTAYHLGDNRGNNILDEITLLCDWQILQIGKIDKQFKEYLDM